VIGLLCSTTESGVAHLVAKFHEGLGQEGYVEGRNVEIVYHFDENRHDRLPALAADLVGRRVALIFTDGGTSSLPAKAATSTIPIVFAGGVDPIGLGLVSSLNHPGANVTGVTVLAQALVVKRLELLHELFPGATSIGFLVNPTNPQSGAEIRDAENAARVLGMRLVFSNAVSPDEIEASLGILAGQQIGAFAVAADALFNAQRAQLAALAAHYSMAAMYFAREFASAGGLMSYGADFSAAWRLAGTYAGRILKGEKPADLPVQQATRIELVINMKTAKALGLTFPITLLGRADEVIE